MSRIITFYSFKGGAGRTLALVNVAILLAKRGKRVLLIDWDLEAPGLDMYFRPYLTQAFPSDRGTIHLLHEASMSPDADWRPHVQRVTVHTANTSSPLSYTVSVIPSGVAAPEYAEKVRSFSWPHFVQEQGGGGVLERWRHEWKQHFDFVLLDSRTGITDTGGICTILLPDFLVLVFTANNQSIEGAMGIAQSAQRERRHLAVPRPPLTILPLLSRFDRRDEVGEAEKWLARCARDMKPFYDDWLPRQFQPLKIIELTKVPYVTLFSFGEPLPVLTHSLTDPDLPGFYLEHTARLLATDFHDAAQIIDPSSQAPLDGQAQVRSFIERAPIDERELHRLLQIAEEEIGVGTSLAVLLNDIGLALQEHGRFASAEPYYRRALTIDESMLGLEHPGVVIHLSSLAQVLQATERFAEAEPLLRRALAITEKSFGPEHLDVATSLRSLAQVLQATERFAEAESLLRRALAITEKSFGPEHLDVATSLRSLAQVLQATERFAEAEPLLRRALAITEKSFGPEHPETVIYLNDLAQLRQPSHRLAAGEPLPRQKNFAKALQLVLVHEGGYVDHPQDPGGATNKGVTLAVFQRFYGASRTKEELRAITDAQLEHIYKTGYWDKCQCDALPDGVDYVVFDQAVNSGPGQSAKWLQAAVGVAVDGAIGPQTMAAALQRAPAQVINTMCDARLAFLQRLRHGALWQTFGRGWQARVDGVRAAGQQLATGASASAAPAPVAAAPSLMPYVDYEIVRRGSRGAWVEKLQEALGITVDGIFGPGTEAALKAYQQDAGLTDYGVAGRKTYQALGLIT